MQEIWNELPELLHQEKLMFIDLFDTIVFYLTRPLFVIGTVGVLLLLDLWFCIWAMDHDNPWLKYIAVGFAVVLTLLIYFFTKN